MTKRNKKKHLIDGREPKNIGDTTLKGYTRLIIETDEENPVPVCVIDDLDIQPADGYRVRLRPNYNE